MTSRERFLKTLAFERPDCPWVRAYAFIWPVVIGALSWIAAAALDKKHMQWPVDVAAILSALPLVVLLLIFVPGVVMADGMKSLEILAAVEALLLGVILPATDGLLIHQSIGKN